MNVSEAMNTAVTDDMERIAYSLFWLVSQKIYDLNQDVNTVDFSKVDHEQVDNLIKNNVLQMKTPIYLYSMPIKPKVFAIVLAATESDAKGLYWNKYKALPGRADDISNSMDMYFYDEVKGYWYMRDYKNSLVDFPHFVMEFEKE